MTDVDIDSEDDGVAPDIRAAYERFEGATPHDAERLATLQRRITIGAGPVLAATRRRQRWSLEPMLRAAVPFALAASVFIGMVVLNEPDASTSAITTTTADASTIMLGVMNRAIRADEAARTLASQDASTTALWSGVAR